MDKRLLTILRCPVTFKGLSVARPDTLRRVNEAIADGRLSNRDGVRLETPLDEALQTDDGKLVYPIVNGIPVLYEGEAILVESA